MGLCQIYELIQKNMTLSQVYTDVNHWAYSNIICITCQLFTVASLTTLQINATVVLLYSSQHQKFSPLLHFKIIIYTTTRFSPYCMVASPWLPGQFSHAHSVLASLDSFVFSAPNINRHYRTYYETVETFKDHRSPKIYKLWGFT